MSRPAVRVENLGKRYRIGERREAYGTLRDSIVRAAQTPFRAGRDHKGNQQVWALRDVSFELGRGQVLGIIGRNGAGKSTLLKVLSRVTRPTVGRAWINGRVGSLLEVGTGFHPELTGRENIYLNGTILGMTKREIEKRFDEIVAFAELDKFLDTPVKRYSSGMYMRLAFSIAAHLEPEILIVDEVLAVGDIGFRKKCLGKMQEVSSREKRTILFVSHDMDAIRRLCTRCIWLEQGRVLADGAPSSIVSEYFSTYSFRAMPSTQIDLMHAARRGTGEARFIALEYSSENDAASFQAYSQGPLIFSLTIESDAPRTVGSVAVSLYDQVGSRLVNADSVLLNRAISLSAGRNLVRIHIDQLYLNPGAYRVGLWLADPITEHSTNMPYDHIESAFEIEVASLEPGESSLSPNSIVPCAFDVIQ